MSDFGEEASPVAPPLNEKSRWQMFPGVQPEGDMTVRETWFFPARKPRPDLGYLLQWSRIVSCPLPFYHETCQGLLSSLCSLTSRPSSSFGLIPKHPAWRWHLKFLFTEDILYAEFSMPGTFLLLSFAIVSAQSLKRCMQSPTEQICVSLLETWTKYFLLLYEMRPKASRPCRHLLNWKVSGRKETERDWQEFLLKILLCI